MQCLLYGLLRNKKIYNKGKVPTITIEWGKENEDFERKENHKIAKKNHERIVLERSGLLIRFDYSHTAASPEGLVR